jgi:hypothetical protein
MKRPASMAAILISIALGCGCSLLPSWRVFQAKIDPKLAEKSADQVEAERRAAAYIVQASAAPASNPAAQVANIHAVAVPLSSSLGEPQLPVVAADQAAVIAALRQGILAEQQKAEQWRAFARKHAGREIEGTGIDIAGPTGLLVLAGIVAACIAFPPIGYVLLRALPLLWSFFRRTTAAIGEFGQENQDAGKQLAAKLSRRMDEAHKKLVRKRVPPTARLPVAAPIPA